MRPPDVATIPVFYFVAPVAAGDRPFSHLLATLE
jgi:hypothetical protein